MGSKAGYKYHYKLFMVQEDEIKSFYDEKKIQPGEKGFLYEFRTNFIVQKISESEHEEDQRQQVGILVDSERFAACTKSHKDKSAELGLLYALIFNRIEEYWMTPSETRSLLEDALTFANLKLNDLENASLRLIPVVVRLHVCTVQRTGERFADAMDRAIRAADMLPLYIWREPTGFLRKPMGVWLHDFLVSLKRIRVGNDEQDGALEIMSVCDICRRRPTVGAVISGLQCKHAFHSHCVVWWLEGSNLCPSCGVAAYDRSIVDKPPIMFPRRR